MCSRNRVFESTITYAAETGCFKVQLHMQQKQGVSKYDFMCSRNRVFKSTITYAAETGCLKAKTVAKLNSTEIDFWRRSARISRKDKIRNIIIKQQMNIGRSLLDDIKTKQVKWYGHVQRMEEGRLPKTVMEWSSLGRRK